MIQYVVPWIRNGLQFLTHGRTTQPADAPTDAGRAWNSEEVAERHDGPDAPPRMLTLSGKVGLPNFLSRKDI